MAFPSSHLNIACRSTWWTTWRSAGTWRSSLLHLAAPTWVQQSGRAGFTLTTSARWWFRELDSALIVFHSLLCTSAGTFWTRTSRYLEAHQSALQCLQVSTSISEGPSSLCISCWDVCHSEKCVSGSLFCTPAQRLPLPKCTEWALELHFRSSLWEKTNKSSWHNMSKKSACRVMPDHHWMSLFLAQISILGL